MAQPLDDKRIAFLATNYFEQVELTEPWRALMQKRYGWSRSFSTSISRWQLSSYGPWILVEAGMVRHRELTSWPSLQTDIKNAGGKWVDQEVVVDQGLVTSRKPDELKVFCAKVIEEFAEGKHPIQDA